MVYYPKDREEIFGFLQNKGEETRISIQDDGLGIPEKVIHSLEEEIGSSIGLKMYIIV